MSPRCGTGLPEEESNTKPGLRPIPSRAGPPAAPTGVPPPSTSGRRLCKAAGNPRLPRSHAAAGMHMRPAQRLPHSAQAALPATSVDFAHQQLRRAASTSQSPPCIVTPSFPESPSVDRAARQAPDAPAGTYASAFPSGLRPIRCRGLSRGASASSSSSFSRLDGLARCFSNPASCARCKSSGKA